MINRREEIWNREYYRNSDRKYEREEIIYNNIEIERDWGGGGGNSYKI